MLFDVGRASGTKLCRLLWNTNLVEIELSSLCLLWSLYLVQCQKTTLVQRSAFAETTCFSVHQKLLQLINGEMSWKENSSLLRLWPYQGMKHTVSQTGEFIDTVKQMIMTYMLLLHCLHPYLLQLSFCHYSYYVIITKTQYILPSC